MDLTVADLGDSWSGGLGGTGGGLDLTVADLGGFGLSVDLLFDDRGGGGGCNWVDCDTEGAGEGGGTALQCSRWGEGGPWFGWDVSS